MAEPRYTPTWHANIGVQERMDIFDEALRSLSIHDQSEIGGLIHNMVKLNIPRLGAMGAREIVAALAMFCVKHDIKSDSGKGRKEVKIQEEGRSLEKLVEQ